MKKLLLSLTSFAVMILMLTGVSSAAAQYTSGTTGVDVGYPNCSTSLPNVVFGIVGTNNGLAYSHNACLSTEASHFNNLSLYANTGWYNQSAHISATSPKTCTTGDSNCLAYNYGYNAGLDAFNYASILGVHSTTWWLDVETSNTWNADVVQNQNSLQGEHDALSANGATTIGVYSTTAQWQSISGGWQNNWPSWGATTWTTATQAATYCTGHQFTGGPSILMQYKSKKSQVDQDVAC